MSEEHKPKTAARWALRRAARLLCAILMFGGIQRFAPFLTWWECLPVGVVAILLSEYAWTGGVSAT